ADASLRPRALDNARVVDVARAHGAPALAAPPSPALPATLQAMAVAPRVTPALVGWARPRLPVLRDDLGPFAARARLHPPVASANRSVVEAQHALHREFLRQQARTPRWLRGAPRATPIGQQGRPAPIEQQDRAAPIEQQDRAAPIEQQGRPAPIEQL